MFFRPIFLRCTATAVPPSDFIAEVFLAKDAVQKQFQIVRHGLVAMEVQRPRGFQNSLAFYQANRHISKVAKVIRRPPLYRANGG